MTSTDAPLTRESVERAIERAHAVVADMCNGSRRWRMTIPADPDHDSDLLISEALRQASEFLDAERVHPLGRLVTHEEQAALDAERARAEAVVEAAERLSRDPDLNGVECRICITERGHDPDCPLPPLRVALDAYRAEP